MIELFGQVAKNGTATLLARVLGWAGAAIVPADIAAAEYSIYELDKDDVDDRDAVDEHDAVELAPADILYDTLQTGVIWSVDVLGYNFAHTIDVLEHTAFAAAGKSYLVEYRLTPADGGQVILLRFRLNCI